MTRTLIHPGTGIYLRSDAARLLRVSPTRLRRWVEGYTYRYQQSGRPVSRRRRPPVVRRGLPMVDGSIALSFVELMEFALLIQRSFDEMQARAERTARLFIYGITDRRRFDRLDRRRR